MTREQSDTDFEQVVAGSASDVAARRTGRRRFLGAGVGAVAVGASLLSSRPAGATSGAPTAFAIDAAPGVNVKVGQGRLFPVTVLDADGEVLREYPRVSSAWLASIDSPYFSVRTITPPSPNVVGV